MIDKEKTASETDIFLESIKSSPQIIKGVERYLGKLLAKPLLRTGISANMVTFLSFVISLMSTPFFLVNERGYLILGAVILNAGYILDYVDGEIARTMKETSKFGKWLDFTFDRILDGIVFTIIIIGVYLSTGNILMGFLGLITLVLRFLIDILRWSPRIIDHEVQIVNEYTQTNFIKSQFLYTKANLYILVLIFSLFGRMDLFIYFWAIYTVCFFMFFYFYLFRAFRKNPGYYDYGSKTKVFK